MTGVLGGRRPPRCEIARERVSEHSRVFGDVPDLPAASRSVRPPWRPHDCTKRESLLVFSVARASRSVSRAFAPGRASRGPRLTHSHGAQWPFQTLVRCRLAAAATPGAHGTPPAQAAQNRRSLTLSESPRGLNPLNCCALALPRPLPHGPWPRRYGMPYRMTYNGTEQSTSSPCVMDAIFMHG